MSKKNEPATPIAKFQRKIILIKRGLQMKYVLLVFATVVLTAFVVSLDLYYVLGKLALEHLGSDQVLGLAREASKLLFFHLSLYFVIVALSSIFISHKFAGPIFRLERVSERIAQGDLTVKVAFRSGDEFTETADYMNRMIASLREKVQKDRNLAERILQKLSDLTERLKNGKIEPKDAARLLEELLVEVDHIGADFKV